MKAKQKHVTHCLPFGKSQKIEVLKQFHPSIMKSQIASGKRAMNSRMYL